MSASIITFANLGKKTNLPTADILPVIIAFAENDALSQVICQINTDFYFAHTVSAVPAIIRYPFRLFERLFGFASREAAEGLFDFFARLRLGKCDVCFLHGVLPKTAEKARAQGSITVEIARTAHAATNARLEQEEFYTLGIAGDADPYFTRLLRKPRIKTDYVIAMSDFVKESYVQAGFPADHVYVASPDIDTRRFSPSDAAPCEAPVFLYMAYTQPIKGLHYLLDAWAKAKVPGAELRIVGGFSTLPPSLKKRYEDAIRDGQNITWKRGVTEPERQYREASAFVFPSLTEGFGRVTLEAMACGVPVITTENARGIVEDGKTGFVVPIRDADALREKIQYLYDHPEETRRMGSEARNAVERKEPFGQEVYRIYRDILRRERMPV